MSNETDARGMENHHTDPPTDYLDPRSHFIDITAPSYGVEVEVRDDGKVLWVNIDGRAVLRVCQMPYIEVRDNRKNK